MKAVRIRILLLCVFTDNKGNESFPVNSEHIALLSETGSVLVEYWDPTDPLATTLAPEYFEVIEFYFATNSSEVEIVKDSPIGTTKIVSLKEILGYDIKRIEF